MMVQRKRASRKYILLQKIPFEKFTEHNDSSSVLDNKYKNLVKQALRQKQILVSKIETSDFNNVKLLNLYVYYRNKRILRCMKQFHPCLNVSPVMINNAKASFNSVVTKPAIVKDNTTLSPKMKFNKRGREAKISQQIDRLRRKVVLSSSKYLLKFSRFIFKQFKDRGFESNVTTVKLNLQGLKKLKTLKTQRRRGSFLKKLFKKKRIKRQNRRTLFFLRQKVNQKIPFFPASALKFKLSLSKLRSILSKLNLMFFNKRFNKFFESRGRGFSIVKKLKLFGRYDRQKRLFSSWKQLNPKRVSRLLLRKRLNLSDQFNTKVKKLNKNNFLLNNNKYGNMMKFKITPLNFKIHKRMTKFFSRRFNQFRGRLFQRGHNLYLDFLRITSLVALKKISVMAYMEILAGIFRYLHKRLHGFFLKFITELLTRLIRLKISRIKGIKFVISGRLKGKNRASSVIISKGRLYLNTSDYDVCYGKIPVHTKYGVYGMNLWVTYKQHRLI
jgi:hypothetical protein